MARSQDLKIGMGFNKQPGTGSPGTTPTQLQTALAAISLWNLGLNQFSIPLPKFLKEDDALFYGKGHEWAETVFPTSIDQPYDHAYHVTSQNCAQVMAFALGKVTATNPGAGAYQYVITPMIPGVDGENLPATTIVAAIQQQLAGELFDIAAIGAICQAFQFSLKKGPGLANSSLTSNWLGSGKFANNSNIIIPDRYEETRIGAGSATEVSIGGINYIDLASFIQADWGWNNNVDAADGYFAGSGQQDGYDIRGRARYGNRTQTLALQAELQAGSPELAALIAGSEGETRFTLEGPTITGMIKHKIDIRFPRTEFKGQELGETNGRVSMQCDISVKNDPTEGPVVITIVTDKAGICAEP